MLRSPRSATEIRFGIAIAAMIRMIANHDEEIPISKETLVPVHLCLVHLRVENDFSYKTRYLRP